MTVNADPFVGSSQMAARMRAFDWAGNALGAVDAWPQSLRSAISICTGSRFPIAIYWGPSLTLLYNDAWSPIPGSKHPWALGRPAAEVWPEIWMDIAPLFEQVMTTGESTYLEDALLPMRRHGYTEECYFNYTFTAIRGEGGRIDGVFNAVVETTYRVIAERRARLLREFSDRLDDPMSAIDACRITPSVLTTSGADVPFCLVYLVEPGQPQARLLAAEGVTDLAAAPPTVALDEADAPWPLMLRRDAAVTVIDDLSSRFPTPLPGGPWPEPAKAAFVAPILAGPSDTPFGFLILGAGPRRAVDDDYLQFAARIADALSTRVASAVAYERERARAEELAALDRAKTTFFANISHEFRTPLALMLGPTEDALASPGRTLSGEALETVHRNELRLLKLVNALLDFSRLEAGQMRAAFEATDLAALTTALAESFTGAFARAGLRYAVKCDRGLAPVYVDPDMWEKIVLNLLSNALKFTFEGGVEVRLSDADDEVRLEVRDTGIGIAAEDVPRVFERFKRVEGARSRTHEGSGIGLSLVNDLVRLHGGRTSVASAPGEGTTVTIALPKGAHHLPTNAIRAATRHTAPTERNPFVVEAMRWLAPVAQRESWPLAEPQQSLPLELSPAPGRILLADDNADMRGYLTQLLAPHWAVEAVADGAAALAAAQKQRPDLVVTDVMMPVMDGFALLQALRADPSTGDVPIIMLSARAGDDARIEGLQAGADDYLVKPFTARELLARVNAQLRLAAAARERQQLLEREQIARREAERLREVAEAANRAKDEFLAMLGHELRNPLAPISTALQLLKLRADDRTERERNIIERQVRHLVGLVDDLLDVSRITRGKVELRREPIEISSVIARAIELASPLLEQQRHTLTVAVPHSGLRVMGDAARLAQIFANLLTNSAKYTPHGGLIEVAAAVDGDTAVVDVRDSGVGISPDMLPYVFDLFVQESQPLARSQGGLGLGLAIVRNLVAMHGGQVSVSSEGKGHGSRFSVRLPLAPVQSVVPAQPDATTPAAAPCNGARVLVVDDNLDGAMMLADLLRAFGYDTRIAQDGPEALRVAEAFDPDIALLDLGLPVMDGFELAERFQQHPRLSRSRLIAVTGYGQPHDRERSAGAGFDAHLVKPVDIAALRAVLDETRNATSAD